MINVIPLLTAIAGGIALPNVTPRQFVAIEAGLSCRSPSTSGLRTVLRAQKPQAWACRTLGTARVAYPKKPPQNPTVAVSWSNDNGNKWLNPLTRGKAGIAVCKGFVA
jgi:hypothetical protein